MPYTKEQHREYMRSYRKRDYVKVVEKECRQKMREYYRLYMRKYREGQEMPESVKLRLRQTQNQKHWARLHGIRQRCESVTHKDYHRYGARGVRCFLSLQDIEFMWNRDAAFLMAVPVLHRQGDIGDYTVENCRFIEKSFHSALTKHKKQLTS